MGPETNRVTEKQTHGGQMVGGGGMGTKESASLSKRSN